MSKKLISGYTLLKAKTGSAYNRFGFNGKEFDWEAKGWMNQYDYGFRIYDPRTGRFLSVDPLRAEYPELTPYQFASNSPISGIDRDGLEYELSTTNDNLRRRAATLRPAPPVTRYFKPNTPNDKSWTQRWRDSKNVLARISYDISNGLYTLPQQLTASVRNEDYVYNIGGNAYRAHGYGDEKQRLTNFVNGATALTPGAPATKVEGVVTKYADDLLGKVGDDILTKVETQVTEQVATYTGVNIKEAVWAQTTFSNVFSDGGRFAGKTVNEVAQALKSGALTAADVTVDIVVRNGKTFILNTRSSAALTKAGIAREAWSVTNRTGQEFFENQLTMQFQRNPSISGVGTTTIKNTTTREVITTGN